MAPWIRIRKELYQQLQKHVQLLLGAEEQDLRRYRDDFEREFQKPWRASTREILFREIVTSDIILLADFHALAQSQRSQLRILKGVAKDVKLVLAVEFFEAKHQTLIDGYMAGDLSEKDFLKQVEWSKSWGFPFENYRPLIRYAQKHHIPVYGINRHFDEQSGKTLKQRDDFAAEKILEIRRLKSDFKIIVVFGDLHLASNHLPKSLTKLKKRKETFRILSVFQNNEKIYFRLLEKEQELSVDVVRMDRDQFCVVSIAPWVKWQNYLLFLEKHLDRELADEEAEYTDHVSRFVKVIATDFNLQINEGNFSIYTPDDDQFWGQLQAKYLGKDLKAFRDLVLESKSFYVPELHIGFLARPSVNHAAQLAMSVVHAEISGWRVFPTPTPECFLKMIWLEAVQYFGSKLINPKRKTDTIQDLRVALASRSPLDRGEEALKIALHQRMKEVLFLTGQNSKLTPAKPRRTASYREASRLLGGMLGEKLYTGFRKKLLSTDAILRLFRRSVDGPGFEEFYFELLEIVEGLPEAFLSKSEKM
jgi:uncharacterized iron-regulated protein